MYNINFDLLQNCERDIVENEIAEEKIFNDININ